jgi:drug/metabolite transporter (DMT)-like permease
MNFFAFFANAQGVVWKKVAKANDDVSIVDYFVLRNVVILAIEIPLLCYLRMNPFTAFPGPDQTNGKSAVTWLSYLIGRSIAGHVCFTLINLSFLFAPLFIILIVFQTNPFSTALLGLCWNREIVQKMEWIAMVLCFVGVCGMGLSSLL